MKYLAGFVALAVFYVVLFRRWPRPKPPDHDAAVYILYTADGTFFDQDAASS